MYWQDQFDWKVRYPEKRIYLMRQHNWAFAAWELEKVKGNLMNQSLLVHVDAHLDDTPDGVFVTGLHEANTEEEILAVAKGHDYVKSGAAPSNCMQIDNFIWASVARGTIGETIFVSHQDEEVLSLDVLFDEAFLKGNENCMEILSRLPEGCTYQHQRYLDIQSFLSGVTLASNQMAQTKILDIDLDYFNLSKSSKDEIQKSLQDLRNFTKWDVITVALSPEFCGGNETAKQLLDIFLQVFELQLSAADEW
ncbi:UPF0489 family protein [Brevibacillus sp. SYSU BS000544]|uniref:UPF0489 family protein n=1 Tax=Brevibacillus sp. SYSU BS000544 TaxID=3416443 RepID=UPI003CE554C0